MTTIDSADGLSVNRTSFQGWNVLVLAVAVGLRAWEIGSQSLSMDETIEASIARLPIAEVITYPDGFPPLFHLALSAWATVFPEPEAGRWVSALAGVAGVYAIGRWTTGVAGPGAGMFAALLTAVSPLHVYFSQELRAYSLYLCFAAFTLAFYFAAIRDDGNRSWLGFVISAVLGLYTHYYLALLVALLAPILLWTRVSLSERRRGIVAFAIIGMLSLPAGWLLIGDLRYQGEHGAMTPFNLASLAYTGFAFVGGFSLGPSLRELHVISAREAFQMVWPWLAVLGPACLWLLWQGARELLRRAESSSVLYLALASCPLIGVAGELAGVGYKVRYVSWVILPLIVWLAAGAANGGRGWSSLFSKFCIGLLLTVQCIAVTNRFNDARYANEDVRSVANVIRRGDAIPIMVVPGYMSPPLAYYLHGRPALYDWLPHVSRDVSPEAPIRSSPPRADGWSLYPPPGFEVPEPLSEAAVDKWLSLVADVTDRDGRFWLVYSRPFHGDPRGLLVERLQREKWIERSEQFAGVILYRGRVPESTRRGDEIRTN